MQKCAWHRPPQSTSASEFSSLVAVHQLIRALPIKPRKVRTIELLLGETSHWVWKIVASNEIFILRQIRELLAPETFRKILAMNQTASDLAIGPRVLGWNEPHQAILTRFIESETRISFANLDAAPYYLAMEALRRLHVATRPSVYFNVHWSAISPWNFIALEVGRSRKGAPPQLRGAAHRIKLFLELIKPWLLRSATMIHGNTHFGNVLHWQKRGNWRVYLLDFNTCSPGHPYVDIAIYALGMTLKQRHKLLHHYLGRLNTRKVSYVNTMLLEICHHAVLLRVAFVAFDCAQVHARDGDQGLSPQDMQRILSADTYPSFMSWRTRARTTSECQRRGIYALREVLDGMPGLMREKARLQSLVDQGDQTSSCDPEIELATVAPS